MTETGTRTYVITGAASGIGAATAELVASRGHRVVTVDLHHADVCVDLTTDDGRRRLVEETTHRCDGIIDALVAAAGTARQGATDVRVNYFGAVATLAGLRPLLARGSDRERCVSPRTPRSGRTTPLWWKHAWPATKRWRRRSRWTISSWSTRRRSARWPGGSVNRRPPTAGPEAIALNAVAPGIIRTPMTADMLADEALSAHLTKAVPMPYGGIADASVVADSWRS